MRNKLSIINKTFIFLTAFTFLTSVKKTYALVIGPIFGIAIINLALYVTGLVSIPVLAVVNYFKKVSFKQKLLITVIILSVIFVITYLIIYIVRNLRGY